MNAIEPVTTARRAATLLMHPLRPRILAAAREPVSASELARRLDQPRQRVNYHVRQLAQEGFLEAAGQQRKRNMVEQQYVASAKGYVLTSEVLGDVAANAEEQRDTTSAAHLVAVCARAESEVAGVMQAARAAGVRVRVTSLLSDIRFATVEERVEFTHELLEAVSEVVARYASPEGRPFRLVVGCYPAVQ